MTDVSIRELRNDGGSVVERALRGELITITRSGTPVAELRPVTRAPLPSAQLLARWRHLPRVDYDELRNDVDAVLDPSL
ncbi:MAG: type II toxin-antitoxin system prevent-host-death family antitoxin [Candidatus Nanopelagicales bacterium]|jgi:prevent-host-death family protein